MKLITGLAIAALAITSGTALAHGPGMGMSGLHAMAAAAAAAQSTAPTTTTTTTTTPAMKPTTTPQPAAKAQAQAIGQPNQSCGSVTAPMTPGNSASAPGSAFNPDGTAGTQYAGQQPQNSVNPVSVSQYDVACFHQP